MTSRTKLVVVPEIATKIRAYANKSALFAVRLKDMSNERKSSVLATMQRFSDFARSIQDGATLNVGNGFTFPDFDNDSPNSLTRVRDPFN